MLGVINVITHSAASLEHGGFVVQGAAGTPGDRQAKDLSWGEAWARAATWGGRRFELGGDTFDITWHAQLRWDRQQGRAVWRQRDGTDAYALGATAYTREDVFNRDLGGRIFARASYGNWTFRAWFALSGGQGTGAISGSGATTYIDPEYGLDALWAKPVSDRGELSLRFYAVLFDTRADLAPTDPVADDCLAATGRPNCRDVISYVTFRPFIEPLFKWDWLQTGAHVTTLGAQVFMDGSFITQFKVAADGSGGTQGNLVPAPLPNAALYAQHVWRGEWGSVNVGLRGDVGLLGQWVSPRLALGKSLWKDGTLKAVFATGFRTPVITERFLEIPGFLTSNPAIGPEHVYSAELDLLQRLKLSSIELSLFGTWWDGIINVRTVMVDGAPINQFANLRTVWSGGVNFGWQGSARPFDWGLSLNYAPGRIRLPADVAQYSAQQLAEIRVSRSSLQQYGSPALGGVFMPVDGMPDFYATGHVSFALDEAGPRLSIAANLNSPRIHGSYSSNPDIIDPRFLDGAWLPWTIDVRSVLELPIATRAAFRLSVTARSYSSNASGPRVGSSSVPIEGGIGLGSNPVAPVNAMAEVSVKL